jgi:Tfp pilus assembly protein PilW
MLETQLQQDLRATADIITREVRRAGALPEAPLPVAVLDTLWWTGSVFGKATKNVLGDPVPSAAYPAGFGVQSSGTNSGYFTFTYYPSSTTAVVLRSTFGFNKVVDANGKGVIKTLVPETSPNGTKQDLTDPRVMDVKEFSVTSQPVSGGTIRIPCPKPCPDGTGDCWPRYQVREVLIKIEAQSSSDATIKRAILSRVRVRNDFVTYPTWPAGSTNTGSICPL